MASEQATPVVPARFHVLCGGSNRLGRRQPWPGAKTLSLRLGSGKSDVHLHIDHLSRALASRLPHPAADLIELAAYVYTADQAARRGDPNRFDYGNRWNRHFRFEVPVRCPEVWQRPRVLEILRNTLGLLTDDGYEFHFTRMADPPPAANYFFGPPAAGEEGGFDEVVLFSGGLDSLAGAVQEVLEGQRKVALVSHSPVSKTYSRQRDLVQRIIDRLPRPGLRPLHAAVKLNKGKRLGRESTQRSRSFLFASIAATVALVLGQPRIRFYENGVVSLNLPISPQVLGARASRTTHPAVLHGFGELFSELFSSTFKVENPFLWKTKTDLLAGLKAAGHADLCAHTCSCALTREQTLQAPHCGRCSQCLDRGLCALAAGLSRAEDPPEGYRSDVLDGPLDGADLTLAESYFATLRKVDRLHDPHAFALEYAETARVLRHVDLAAEQAAAAVFNLYRRHARQVLEAVGGEVGRRGVDLVRRPRPRPCVLVVSLGACRPTRRPGGDQQASEEEPGRTGSHQLWLSEETFTAHFGARGCFLGNTLEYHLLDRLNRRPGLFVTHATLKADVWGERFVAKNTIQRTVSNLRTRLRNAAFEGVEINGEEPDNYQLLIH